MVKNIYSPLSGALAQERVLEIISNNMANMNTTAFKEDRVTFSLLEAEPEKAYQPPFPQANFKQNIEDVYPLHGNEMAYVGIADVTRDVSQGPVIQTGNPTDVMIKGQGMFAVQTPEGIRYTRDGSLTLNTDGVLVTKSGNPVLGERGNVFVRGESFEINHRGEVYQDNQLVDRLLIYRFDDDKALERVGLNQFHYGGEAAGRTRVEHPAVLQGSLEGSNVNPIRNLTSMIMAHRSYEAYQKALQNFDKMMDKSSNTIGDLR